MQNPHRQIRKVPASKVREWLVALGERSTRDPHNTELRRLSNRLYDFCQRAGAPGATVAVRGTSAAAMAPSGGDLPGVDWTSGEIPFAPRPGFGAKTIERLIRRVVAVTRIGE